MEFDKRAWAETYKGKRMKWFNSRGVEITEVIIGDYFENSEAFTDEITQEPWCVMNGFHKSLLGCWKLVEAPTTSFILED